VFNGAATLKRALDSVLGQSLQNLEVLVVDDGSSDESSSIAEQIGDARVRCIRHNRNQGAAAARNTGVLVAKGRYVAFIDADDEWLPDKLAKQHCYLSGAGKGVTAVCSGFIIQRDGRVLGQARIPKARSGWDRELLDVCSLAPGTTLIVDRRVFGEVGPLCTDLERFEDWDWLLRYLSR
jgi:glycosyltransferase involved in cell wall biosynthesis